MSLSAKSATRKVSAIRSRYIDADARSEIRAYLEGCLAPYWELSQEEADAIAQNRRNWTHDKLMAHLSRAGKSRGARYIAARILSKAEPDLYRLTQDWFAHRNIKRELSAAELREIGADAGHLRKIGIRFRWEARAFYSLYREVMDKGRVWGSCCQINKWHVKVIALTPNYNRLPLWVKRVMVAAFDSWSSGSDARIGNVWRLIDCAKAWKHAPVLPKNIAEKVGKMSPRSRVLARWAWEEVTGRVAGRTVRFFHERGWDFAGYSSRQELVTNFWQELRRLQSASLPALLQERIAWGEEGRPSKEDHNALRRIAEGVLELPHGFLFDAWGLHRNASQDVYLEAIASHGDAASVCRQLFGTAGRRTVTLFKNASKDAWQWASAICDGNADAVQKVLEMKEVISFQPEAVDFLKSLPIQSRIRLLGATTFKYRGEVHPISPDHVRDTGYLWKNIRQKPELGRIRCWFSVHEQLSAAFVRELPDEPLPIPAGWERVDGLCAVDGAWSLEVPKSVATLKYYGEVLRNCVGGYGPAIKSGRSVVFAVREHGIPTHCVEVCGRHVNQFYQAGNSNPDPLIKDSVCAVLRQAGLIS